jgi:hypothetical protein
MVRILAILAVTAALALGQRGLSPSEASAVPGDGIVIAAFVNMSPRGTTQPDNQRCPPSHARCHSSCSPTVAMDRGAAALRSRDLSTIGLQLVECSPRSIVLKRDPPIPKALV